MIHEIMRNLMILLGFYGAMECFSYVFTIFEEKFKIQMGKQNTKNNQPSLKMVICWITL